MIDLRHLAPPAKGGQPPGFEGKWHAIEFQPDLTVPQRFVIGVALSHKGKLSHFRVAQEAPRLKCFYAHRFSKDVWEWMRSTLMAELAASKGEAVSKLESTSPQINLGEGFYASASDADTALSRTFDRIVTVVRGERKANNKGIAQDALRLQVAGLLKAKMSTRYETISQPDGGLQISDNGTVHWFDIGYDDHVTAASVVSGCYVSLDTAQLNVMTAMNDLNMFLRIRKRDQIGIAVLTPSPQTLPTEAVQMWQDWWSHFSYKLRKSDLVLLAESTSAVELADKVFDWYPESSTT